MIRRFNTIDVLVLVAVSVGIAQAEDRQPSSEATITSAKKFLTTYCVDCHSGNEPAGERDFDSLDLAQSDFKTQLNLQQVIDQLALESMPPKDSDQPSSAERSKAVEFLNQRLVAMRQKSPPPQPAIVLRRLSRREYRRTIGDLLGIDMTMFDPTEDFPGDDLADHFDNVGDTLVMSGHLMDNYLAAADQCVEKAWEIHERPEVRKWTFDRDFRQQSQLDEAHQRAFKREFLCLYDHPQNDKAEGAFGHLHNFRSGVPVSGIYEVRVLAKAMNRDAPYSNKSMWIDLQEPFRMGIRPGENALGDMENRQPVQPLLAGAVIADDDFHWYAFHIPLDRGFAPRFTFENGYHDFRGMIGRIYRYDKDRLPKKCLPDSNGIFARRIALISHANLPHIRIDKVELRGPVRPAPSVEDASQKSSLGHATTGGPSTYSTYNREAWPSRSRQLLLGGTAFDESQARPLIERFATRAFRRPPTKKEVDGLVDFYLSRRDGGMAAEQAFKDTLKAAMCSPGFLYFKQPIATESGEDGESGQSQHALAERLSYFLTSTMPDDRLRALADRGQLADPKTLRSEVRRLLADPSSDAFVADFLASWLNLRALGSMPPDANTFRIYYAADLQNDMALESRMFFRDLIERNAPITEMISANYSFVNRDLAKLYGVAEQVPVATAGEFRRIEFDDERRGGLLGQASILTVSANGIETSPIVRGVWMLENILGMPTPPPPDDVPAIEPDTRGATTIRDQLSQHRDNEACFRCHRKIDPLGFALESFDAIGQSRTSYNGKNRRPIDTSGELPGGERFSGLPELKKILMKRKSFFVRTVTERLLTHALGRRIEPMDRGDVDQILATVRDQDYPTASLIESVVLSDLFRR